MYPTVCGGRYPETVPEGCVKQSIGKLPLQAPMWKLSDSSVVTVHSLITNFAECFCEEACPITNAPFSPMGLLK